MFVIDLNCPFSYQLALDTTKKAVYLKKCTHSTD